MRRRCVADHLVRRRWKNNNISLQDTYIPQWQRSLVAEPGNVNKIHGKHLEDAAERLPRDFGPAGRRPGPAVPDLGQAPLRHRESQ